MIEEINENQEYCYLRLPCGICRLMMATCPKVNEVYSIIPTWVSANCEVNIRTNNEVTEVTE